MPRLMLVFALAALGVLAGWLGGLLGYHISRRLGLYGVDVFKPWRREKVPEAGGAGLAAALATLYMLAGVSAESSVLTAAGLLALYTLIVGLSDDLWRMDPVTKPLLTMASASIPFALGAYQATIYIPVYDKWARLTIVYPLVMPLVLGVSANAVNMVDVVNGSAPTAVVLVTAALLASSMVMSFGLGWSPPADAVAFAVSLLTATLTYLLLYNRYPARMFNGDSGSLTLGALLGYAALTLKQEAVFLVAMTPLILNGFQIIATVRGFAERRQIPRPTRVDENGVIHPVCRENVPPTLVQLIVLDGPRDELSVYKALLALYTLSAAAAIISSILYYVIL